MAVSWSKQKNVSEVAAKLRTDLGLGTATLADADGNLKYENTPFNLRTNGYVLTDANDFASVGWAVGNNALNAPTNTGDGDWYIYRNDVSAEKWGTQTAYSFFTDTVYTRRLNSGVPTAWTQSVVSASDVANVPQVLAASAYIKSPVKLSQFVASAANGDAAMAAFLAALKDGSRQYDGHIDVGVDLASPCSITNYTGTLEGRNDGFLQFTAVGNGLTIDNSSVEWYEPRTLKLYDLTILTTVGSEQIGHGLRVFGSQAQSDNLVPTLDAEGINIMGDTPATGWWVGMELTQIKKASIRAPRFRGRVPATLNVPGALDAATFANIIARDGCNQVDVHSLRADWAQYGVAVLNYEGDTMSEGVNLHGGDVRASRVGFFAAPGIGNQFQAIGTHFDVSSRGVVFGSDSVDGANFSFARGCFILRSPVEGLSNEWIGIDFNSNYGSCTDNTVWTPVHNGHNHLARGINIGRDGNAGKVGKAVVANNLLIACDTGIILRNTTTACKGANNVLQDGNAAQTAIINSGSGNSVTA